MKGFSWGVLFGALLVAVVWSLPAAAQEQVDSARIYGEQCAPCHGAEGEGGVGPGLVDSQLSVSEQVAVVSSGTDAMPSFGTALLADEIEAVVEYAAAFGDSQPEDEEVPEGGEQAEDSGRSGSEVYSQGCAACHGDDASGGSGGPSLLEGRLSSEEMAVVVAVGGGRMPAFEQVYTPAEIEAVAEYIVALATNPPPVANPVAAGAELYAVQCASCHGTDALGATAPSLVPSSRSSDELASIITEGGPTMPAFDSLHPDEVGWLVAYIEAAGDAAGTTEPEVTGTSEGSAGATSTTIAGNTAANPPPLLAGQMVFAENCGLCHGAEGDGGSAPSLRGLDLNANEIITRVYGGHSAGMPAFRQTLTSAEVQEVALYVITLPKPVSEGWSFGNVVIVGAIALVLAVAAYAAWRWGSRRRQPART